MASVVRTQVMLPAFPLITLQLVGGKLVLSNPSIIGEARGNSTVKLLAAVSFTGLASAEPLGLFV